MNTRYFGIAVIPGANDFAGPSATGRGGESSSEVEFKNSSRNVAAEAAAPIANRAKNERRLITVQHYPQNGVFRSS